MPQTAQEHDNLDLIRPVWHHLSPTSVSNAGELFQTSLMAALLSGIYEGGVTYGELRHHGDFGLGTFNDLDGEMVGFGGVFHQVRSDGSATLVKDNQRTPFAVVTFFEPEIEWNVERPISKKNLLASIEDVVDKNLFAAVLVDGVFDSVSTRTVKRQQKPYPPLTEAAAHQTVNVFKDVSGKLAGFWTPPYAQGIGVAGFHLHFLRSDGLAGGHALDYLLREGTVQIQVLHSFHVELPDSKEFLHASLSGSAVDAGIKDSEG